MLFIATTFVALNLCNRLLVSPFHFSSTQFNRNCMCVCLCGLYGGPCNGVLAGGGGGGVVTRAIKSGWQAAE